MSEEIVLAVTRGGFGAFYSFATRQEADLHPLVQYGDTIMCGQDDILKQYNLLELPRLLGGLGDEKLRVEILSVVHPHLGLTDRERISRVASRAEYIWARMKVVAQPAPTDPSTICSLVTSDRVAMTINPKENRMPDDQKNEVAAAPKPEKVAKPPKEPKAKPFAEDQVITFGADKNGKKYDAAENNPKRPATKAHEQFAQFKDGQTVGEYVKAIGAEGAAYGELKWSADQGFIHISGYTPPPKPEKAPAAAPAAAA